MILNENILGLDTIIFLKDFIKNTIIYIKLFKKLNVLH